MTEHKHRVAYMMALSFTVLALFVVPMVAETAKVEGLIIGRSGDEMIVQFGSGAELVFLLTDSTQASQIGGFFKARRKKITMLKDTRTI